MARRGVRRACTVCGRPSDQRRCPDHRRTDLRPTWSPNRDRAAQARFRKAVLERDGHRCTYIEEDGGRCPAMRNLRAHHLEPLRNFAPGDPAAYDPSNGTTLCEQHDRMVDACAR